MYRIFIFAVIFITGCVPVNSTFDSARMLQKDLVQVRGSFSGYNYSAHDETDPSNNNYGFGIGYGISDKFTLKSRYEFITFPDNSEDFYHYFDIAPKFAIVHNKLAFQLPFGVYTADGNEPAYVISPQLLATYPIRLSSSEMTVGLKTDIQLDGEDIDIPIGINLGLGFGRDLNRWAIRPEIGWMFNTSEKESSFTYGIGFNLNFPLWSY